MFANIVRAHARAASASTRTVAPAAFSIFAGSHQPALRSRTSDDIARAFRAIREYNRDSSYAPAEGGRYRERAPRQPREQNLEPSTTLFVGNLPYSADDAELRDVLSDLGGVQSISIKYDRATGQSRGFGHVQFETIDQATAAMVAMNRGGLLLQGRNLRADYALAPVERVREPSNKLFIPDFAGEEEELRRFFEEFEGNIQDVTITPHHANPDKKFANVVFNSIEEATDALGKLQGREFAYGQPLTIVYGRPDRVASQDSYGNRSGGGYNREERGGMRGRGRGDGGYSPRGYNSRQGGEGGYSQNRGGRGGGSYGSRSGSSYEGSERGYGEGY